MRNLLNIVVLVILGLIAWSCIENEKREERTYSFPINISPEITEPSQPQQETVVPPKTEETNQKEVSETPRKKPDKQPQPSKEKKKALAELSKLKSKFKKRNLLYSDLPNGVDRLKSAEKLIKGSNPKAGASLVNSLSRDVDAIAIDETFILEKNSRLLSRIQAVQPNATIRQKIDAESEQINELLEKEDYAAINQRMNGMFELLK